MNEAGEMYEELNKWLELINRLQVLALEMDSHEQDKDFMNREIEYLMDIEQEDDYTLTFHDSRSPKKVKFSVSWEYVPFDEID